MRPEIYVRVAISSRKVRLMSVVFSLRRTSSLSQKDS